MRVNLTETAITKAARDTQETKRRIDLADDGCTGLWLRVTPKGTRSWVLVARDRNGASRRFPLGSHPAIGIGAAREAARRMRVTVRAEGASDPIATAKRERRVAKDAKAGIGTLQALLEQYERAEGTKLKSWAECRRRVESVFKSHLSKPLVRLTLVDIQQTADDWPSKQSAAAAVRYLRPILKWAVHRRMVSAETTTIKPPARVGRRDRVLSRGELAALLPALTKSARPYAAALRFILLTLCRREEAAAAVWRDIDLDQATWTIPENKSDRPHVVPLSSQAVALLRNRLRKDKRGNVVKPAASALVFMTDTGGALSNWDRETKVVMKVSGTSDWTRHDLRRTGATICAELGAAPHVVESALNHAAVHSQLASIYNQHRYGTEVREALQLLADELEKIETSATDRVEPTAAEKA